MVTGRRRDRGLPTTSLDRTPTGHACFVWCVDCGMRLSCGLVGTDWRSRAPDETGPPVPWDVVPRYPPACYGPPAPDLTCRCLACHARACRDAHGP